MQQRLQSFSHALRGIATCIKEEPNFRIHLLATLCVIGLGIFVDLNRFEWAITILTIGVVLTAELINSAIENAADGISLEHNSFIGKAKDIAAGAVFLCSIVAAVIGGIIFIPKFF